MKHAPYVVASILLTVGLAGCTAPGDGPGDEGHDHGHGFDDTAGSGDSTHPGRYVAWELSDFWSWDMDIRGFERFDASTLAYYEKAGPEYVVGTPDRDEAVYHAVFSVNPILGRIHEGLLSPHESGDHAHMFPFTSSTDTIEDGQTWDGARFYDHAIDCEATASDTVPSPAGPATGFQIACDSPENPAFNIEFSYVAEYKWFTYLRVTDDDGQMFSLTLNDHGTGYSGPAHFIRARDLLSTTLSSDGALLTRSETFTVAQAHVDDHRVEGFAIAAEIQADTGTADIIITDPDGNTIYERSYEDTSADQETNIDEVYPGGSPPTQALGSRPQWPAGEYTVEFRFAGNAQADVIIVGLQDNSGRV